MRDHIRGTRETEANDDAYLKKTYRNIIALALLAHGSYILIFAYLHFTIPAVYNIGSVLFYCLMLYTTHRGLYRLSVTLVHLEVGLFVVVCSLTGGWEMGIAFYLIAMSSLVYFCPFRHRYVTYLFAFMEVALFFILFFFLSGHEAYYPPPSKKTLELLYLYNAATCFIIIIYSAFLSKVSATVSRQELEQKNDGLSMLANYDQLTGLLTRRAFMERFQKRSESGAMGVLVMADIDNFKMINDTYGHMGGDYILKTVAELMRAGCAQADICRYGGEEFIMMLQGLDWDAGKEQIQRLCDDIAAYPFQFEGKAFHVTVTFGLCLPGEDMRFGDMVACADRRLYIGKANGKNQIVAEG